MSGVVLRIWEREGAGDGFEWTQNATKISKIKKLIHGIMSTSIDDETYMFTQTAQDSLNILIT